jgi:hypothetical protein
MAELEVIRLLSSECGRVQAIPPTLRRRAQRSACECKSVIEVAKAIRSRILVTNGARFWRKNAAPAWESIMQKSWLSTPASVSSEAPFKFTPYVNFARTRAMNR